MKLLLLSGFLGSCTALVGGPRTTRRRIVASMVGEETPQRLASMALPYDSLTQLVGGSGRAKTVWEYLRAGGDPSSAEAVDVLSRRTREAIDAFYTEFVPAEIDGDPEVSADGTTKLIIKLSDGQRVETVLIPHQKLPRTTLCVSSQCGCDRGCTFCATARMGLVRSLTADEILAQVFLARKVAAASAGTMPPLTNIVFMGMGDAGCNTANVRLATESLVDPFKFKFAQSKITLSTVGPSPESFEELSKAPGMLAWSLHSADDELRRRLVPSSQRHTVVQLRQGLLDALEGRTKKKRTLMVAATLISGINDSDEDARQLALFISPLIDSAEKVSVDLIPVNPTAHAPDFLRPSAQRLLSYVDTCKRAEPRLHIALRVTRGDDGNAACGQLLQTREKKQKKEEEPAPC